MYLQNKRGLVIKCSHFQPAELPEASLEEDDTAAFDFKPRPRLRPFRNAPPTSCSMLVPLKPPPPPSSLAKAPNVPHDGICVFSLCKHRGKVDAI